MNKIISYSSFAGIVLLVFCTQSCSNVDSDVINQEYKRFEHLYQSEKIEDAEKALLSHREALQSWQKKSVKGFGFDQAYAAADARLFVLYNTSGNRQKAQHYFNSATNYMARIDRQKGREEHVYTEEEIMNIIKSGDANLDVRWRK